MFSANTHPEQNLCYCFSVINGSVEDNMRADMSYVRSSALIWQPDKTIGIVPVRDFMLSTTMTANTTLEKEYCDETLSELFDMVSVTPFPIFFFFVEKNIISEQIFKTHVFVYEEKLVETLSSNQILEQESLFLKYIEKHIGRMYLGNPKMFWGIEPCENVMDVQKCREMECRLQHERLTLNPYIRIGKYYAIFLPPYYNIYLAELTDAIANSFLIQEARTNLSPNALVLNIGKNTCMSNFKVIQSLYTYVSSMYVGFHKTKPIIVPPNAKNRLINTYMYTEATLVVVPSTLLPIWIHLKNKVQSDKILIVDSEATSLKVTFKEIQNVMFVVVREDVLISLAHAILFGQLARLIPVRRKAINILLRDLNVCDRMYSIFSDENVCLMNYHWNRIILSNGVSFISEIHEMLLESTSNCPFRRLFSCDSMWVIPEYELSDEVLVFLLPYLVRHLSERLVGSIPVHSFKKMYTFDLHDIFQDSFTCFDEVVLKCKQISVSLPYSMSTYYKCIQMHQSQNFLCSFLLGKSIQQLHHTDLDFLSVEDALDEMQEAFDLLKSSDNDPKYHKMLQEFERTFRRNIVLIQKWFRDTESNSSDNDEEEEEDKEDEEMSESKTQNLHEEEEPESSKSNESPNNGEDGEEAEIEIEIESAPPQNRSDNSEFICAICYEEKCSSIFYCGHAFCTPCAYRLIVIERQQVRRKCPMCNTPIEIDNIYNIVPPGHSSGEAKYTRFVSRDKMKELSTEILRCISCIVFVPDAKASKIFKRLKRMYERNNNIRMAEDYEQLVDAQLWFSSFATTSKEKGGQNVETNQRCLLIKFSIMNAYLTKMMFWGVSDIFFWSDPTLDRLFSMSNLADFLYNRVFIYNSLIHKLGLWSDINASTNVNHGHNMLNVTTLCFRDTIETKINPRLMM